MDLIKELLDKPELIKQIELVHPTLSQVLIIGWTVLFVTLILARFIFKLRVNPFLQLHLPIRERLTRLPYQWLVTAMIILTLLFTYLSGVLLCLSAGEPVIRQLKVSREIMGIDIVIVIDVSTSMLAMDIKPNRLEAAKREAINFILGRKEDRIGLVVFAGEAVTLVPLTTDKTHIIRWIQDLNTQMLPDGTAIGLGLAVASARLKESKAHSKVIILITDGENNTGFITPEAALAIAKELGIRIYTIGIGSYGKALYPVQTPFGTTYRTVEVRINESLLRTLANETGGRYFRVSETDYLKKVFEEINRLEKSKLEEEITVIEEHVPEYYLVGALLSLAIAFTIRVLTGPFDEY